MYYVLCWLQTVLTVPILCSLIGIGGRPLWTVRWKSARRRIWNAVRKGMMDSILCCFCCCSCNYCWGCCYGYFYCWLYTDRILFLIIICRALWSWEGAIGRWGAQVGGEGGGQWPGGDQQDGEETGSPAYQPKVRGMVPTVLSVSSH